MNILFLTKYDNLAASSRLRAYQYKDYMDSSRFEVDVKPLLSNRYLERKFSNKRIGIFYLTYLFIKRILTLINIRKYDVIIIHLELFPFLPPLFEWFLFKTNKKIYFDFDDAIYHRYDMSNNFFIRLFLSSKIKYLMKMADGVIAGNHYTEKYAHNSGATNILELPTVIDIDSYIKEPLDSIPNKSFTVGWIGSPSTSEYLEIVKDSLSRLGQITPVTLYVVGAPNDLNLSIDNVQIISVKWSEENEQKALKEFDVGIMPLYDEPWEQGKCAFKLIQYMASFLPVVSSDVGMNAEIIHNRGNGLLATTSDDWFDSLYKIYSDQNIRKVMGNNGRRLIEKNFTIQSRLADFEEFIYEVIQPVEAIPLYQEFEKSLTLNNYSVVTIGLNCASTIARTIDSVLSQKNLPKQYIFVLGTSEDDSYNLVLSYKNDIEEQGIEFLLIEEQEKSIAGIPVAWNLGIEKVEADVVAILNADDFYPSINTMSIVLENFSQKEECLIVSGRIIYTNTEKTQINRSERLFPFLNPYNHPATFIAKKLYDEIGDYNTSYIVSADYDFLYRAYSLGYKFFINNDILVSMEPGGFASQNKKIGRAEAYKIASSYTKTNFLPGLALVLRFILRK